MQFIHNNAHVAGNAIAGRLAGLLQTDRRVLWLVCGGSSIATEAHIMTSLRETCADKLAHLTILTGDDRYGPPGHPDSNYRQLKEAGFDPANATWHDVLENDAPLEETVEHYSELFQAAQTQADLVISIFGIGTDGHTAGVKPRSPAVADDLASVAGYKWDDFTRLTLTPHELIKTDVGFLLAYGDDKRPVLERLRAGGEPIQDMPCMLLHNIVDMTVYNDQIGDKE